MAQKMGAIRINENGGPEVLEWTSIDIPKPGPDQILVRLAAAGVNFIDVYHRDGLYPIDLPFTPGVEGAGTIEEVGAEVTTVAGGDRVAWAGAIGSYAEYAVVIADQAVAVPDGVELDQAAALVLQGLTAHYLVTDTFPLQAGQSCLIHAGAGGVGQLLIQMAKMLGATVFATVSTEDKAGLARQAGADHVINYAETDYAKAVEAIAGEKALDVVYDGVGADTVERGLELLRPRGMMVSYGNASGRPPEVDPLQLMRLGSLFVTRPTMGDYVATRDELVGRADELYRWLEAGTLAVHIGNRFPLAEAGEAHRALQGRMTTGKVLLDV